MDKYVAANAVFSKFSRNFMERKKGLPIRPSEMGVLNILVETPGPHTSVMLAELLGVSKPMITAHLTVLLEKGYITKTQSPNDKRAFYILPTSKATALVSSFKADMSRQFDQLVSALGQEGFDTLVTLAAQANHVLENMEGESLWI